mgnify:CR=1 FL=1
MNIEVMGKELEYDFFDADNIEKYEASNLRVSERIGEKKQYEGKSTADAIRLQCSIIDDFFDELFGEGTSKELFGGKSNIKDHMEAFATVADAARSCNQELTALGDKYNPNRAERRAQQKQNAKNFNRNNAAHNKNKKNH